MVFIRALQRVALLNKPIITNSPYYLRCFSSGGSLDDFITFSDRTHASTPNKVVLITGASTGIGAATAVQFAQLGYSLALTAKTGAYDEQALSETVSNCLRANSSLHTDNILTILGDLTVEKECQDVVEQTIDKFQRLDVLIPNAGIFAVNSLATTPMEEFDKVMNINCRSVVHIMKLAIPHLIETKGNIVNISSIAGLRAFANRMSYCVSKAAVAQLTRCAALELAPKGVRVNAVNPGVITSTRIAQNAGLPEEFYNRVAEQSKTAHPIGRAGTPQEVAKAIAFLASDDHAAFITGITLSIDGGRAVACP